MKDEPTIPPTNLSIDQPNNLTNSNFNLTFVDEPIPKQNKMTRLLYHNSGSLGISTNSHNLEVICEALFTHEIDIASLVETNNHWKDDKSLPKLKQVLKQFWSRINISTSKTITPWKSINKPCGSVTISTPNIASSVINTGEYKEGLERWSCVTYGGKKKEESYNNISISNLYSKRQPRHIHDTFTTMGHSRRTSARTRKY